MSPGRLPFFVLLRTFARSLLLQASWNFERMQGLGALYVLAPALRFYYQGEALHRAYGRHTEYFNTHPYLAPALLGATLHLEEGRATANGAAVGPNELKRMLMAPCAAMGDALFWGGVRPLAAVLGVWCAVQGFLWAPLVLLTVFNVPHLWFRAAGLWRGYRLGTGIVDWLQRSRLPDRAVLLKQLTVVLLGALCARQAVVTLRGEGLEVVWGGMVLPLTLLIGWLGRFSVSPLLLSLGAMALLMLMHSV